MSSIQYSLPIATNKVMGNVDNTRTEILNRMNTYRTASEKVFDYYVEPVYIEGRQEYMVSFVYINNIHVIGKLCTKDTSDLQPVTGDTIPNFVLVNGKLYSSTGYPYKIDDYNTVEGYFKMVALYGGIELHIELSVEDLSKSTAGIYRMTYNHTHETMEYDGNNQDNLPQQIYKSVYIPYSEIVNEQPIHNNVFYLASIPIVASDVVECYSINP